MDDRRADLTLDVVADDRKAAQAEALGPFRARSNEDRDAIDEGAAGLERLQRIPLGRLLRADRQIADDHVSGRVAKDGGDVSDAGVGFLDPTSDILADTVEGRSAVHLDALWENVGETGRIVWFCKDCFGDVAIDLVLVDVESGRDLDVLQTIAADLGVHQAGRRFVSGGVRIELQALNERRGAVANPDDTDTYLAPRRGRHVHAKLRCARKQTASPAGESRSISAAR
jgi:hypothetical protein